MVGSIEHGNVIRPDFGGKKEKPNTPNTKEELDEKLRGIPDPERPKVLFGEKGNPMAEIAVRQQLFEHTLASFLDLDELPDDKLRAVQAARTDDEVARFPHMTRPETIEYAQAIAERLGWKRNYFGRSLPKKIVGGI